MAERQQLKLTVDAMGGPIPLTELVAVSLHIHSEMDVAVRLVGDGHELEDAIRSRNHAISALEVVHTDEVISRRENGLRSLKLKRGTSMQRALELAEQDGTPIISFGNINALWHLAKQTMVPTGMASPFATVLKTTAKPITLLDVGPTPTFSAKSLLEYGLLGSVFHRTVTSVSEPTVGLLATEVVSNNAPDFLREAHRLLHERCPSYAGLISGGQFVQDSPDVVVCDALLGGFLGAYLNHQKLAVKNEETGFGRSLRSWVTPRAKIKAELHRKRFQSHVLLGAKRLVLTDPLARSTHDIHNVFKDACALAESNFLDGIDSLIRETTNYDMRTTTERPAFQS